MSTSLYGWRLYGDYGVVEAVYGPLSNLLHGETHDEFCAGG